MRKPLQLTHLSSIFLLAAAAVIVAGCSRASSSDFTAQAVSDDFSTQLVSSDWVAPVRATAGITRVGCQSLIAKAMCLTNASESDIARDWQHIPCLGHAEGYVQAAMMLSDEMPSRLLPLFCSVDRIFISPNVSSVARATALYNRGGAVVGSYLNFRLATFMNPPMIRDLATWKEQLLFGGSTNFLSNDPNLVQIDYGLHLQRLSHDGLFYVLIHELGHLVDFNNRINACHANGNCTFGDWLKISWAAPQVPLPSAVFSGQNKLCYYNCQGRTLQPDQAFEVYKSLASSSFPTTYSGANELEDFAESFAWYIMRQTKSPDYKIMVPGHGTFSMNDVFVKNPVIALKQNYMNALWNSPSLKLTNGTP